MTRKYQLAPSVYAADYLHLEQQLKTLECGGVKQLHIDIMDGIFVPNLSFGPDFVAALRAGTGMYLDVHLMITEPLRFVEEFAKAGADGLTVHWEACEDVGQALKVIHDFGCQAGLAFKPETSLERVEQEMTRQKLFGQVDRLQLMTVAPGLRGQKFLPDSLQRIAEARQMLKRAGREIPIAADGDITLRNLKPVLEAGTEIAVIGKGLFIGDLGQNTGAYQAAMNQTAV